MFYTYDTDDFNKLDEEFDNITKYLDNLPKNYRGSISYDVSLGYADMCLKRLYDFLDEHNMLDNVNIFICADHGSSYTYDPYRSNYVNNFHRENYNMPFVIWSKDLVPFVDTNFHNTKDIPATILDMNNLKLPKDYDGMSILNSNGRDYVLIENVKGGCPDYNLRDFWLGVRNRSYLVVMTVNINKPFNECTLDAVYDLKTDKLELHNLKDTISKSVIEKELKILEKELNELVADTKKYNFKNNR
jgi:arylsulfatase A-like enzyme